MFQLQKFMQILTKTSLF